MDDPKLLLKLFNFDIKDIVDEVAMQKDTSMVYCPVCYEEYPNNTMMGMICGHRFCNDCYKGYLECIIKDGPECIYSTCPDSKCRLVVTEEIFKKLVAKKFYAKYDKYIVKSYVDNN
jgi:ariadne-1